MPTRSDGRIRHTIVFTLGRESRPEGDGDSLDGVARLEATRRRGAFATAAL